MTNNDVTRALTHSTALQPIPTSTSTPRPSEHARCRREWLCARVGSDRPRTDRSRFAFDLDHHGVRSSMRPTPARCFVTLVALLAAAGGCQTPPSARARTPDGGPPDAVGALDGESPDGPSLSTTAALRLIAPLIIGCAPSDGCAAGKTPGRRVGGQRLHPTQGSLPRRKCSRSRFSWSRRPSGRLSARRSRRGPSPHRGVHALLHLLSFPS